MCGIIGYLDDDLGVSYVIDGLKKLEYRGYDSCGIAVGDSDNLTVYKSTKRIENLSNQVLTDGNLIIAHTRWATHGKVTVSNAHPIASFDKNYLIVHNGIIENYQSLKEKYLSGINHHSETDTEVIVNLIELFAKENSNIMEVIRLVSSLLIGSFACLIIDKRDLSKIYFMKRNSPLLIGRGKEKGFFIASDVLAFNEKVIAYYRLENNDIGYVTKDSLFVYQNLSLISPKFIPYNYNKDNYSLGIYHHYMEKEIREEPFILKSYLGYYLNQDGLLFKQEIKDLFKDFKHQIYIIGSGTSYHASLYGSHFFKTISKIKSYAILSSEFDLDEELFSNGDLFIVISQSGETADLIKAIEQLKNHIVIAITNVTTSTIAAMSDYVIDMKAGLEIAVASTKAYLSSVTILYLLANMARHINPYNRYLKAVDYLPKVFEEIPSIINIAKKIAPKEHLFFLGKNTDYLLAKEASLKLKEISYIHSESFEAGELKHGSIALICDNTPVIALITNEKYHLLIRNAIEEVKARGATIYIISTRNLSKDSDDIILENTEGDLNYLSASIIFQLLAYYTALERGNDIDKPRNLAKSVTVL